MMMTFSRLRRIARDFSSRNCCSLKQNAIAPLPSVWRTGANVRAIPEHLNSMRSCSARKVAAGLFFRALAKRRMKRWASSCASRSSLKRASLGSFLAWLGAAGVEVKRDMEAAGSAVRVMTVHASKGLEAKIVYLPEKCTDKYRHHDEPVLRDESAGAGPLLVWRTRKDDDPAQVQALQAREHQLEEEEHRRLLYVALTRAEERLFIAGYSTTQKPVDPQCWYAMAQRAMTGLGQEAPALESGHETVLRFGAPAQLPQSAAPARSAVAAKAWPHWLRTPAPVESVPVPPLRPSQNLPAADQLDPVPPSAPNINALAEGELAHTLLQYLPGLPADARAAAGANFMSLRAVQLPEARRAAVLDEVLAALAREELQALFSEGSRAEVSLAARVPDGRGGVWRIAGRI
ncbi:MAG: hypothetical protein FJX29_11370, partial [Alphaproteobacteria bacterium]|nr:hypothetical protein [Alphaproteobacteria bacterium]